MPTIQIKDTDLLLTKALALHRPIQVSTYHTVAPDAHDVRRPGLLLQYSLVLDDDDERPLIWTFLEIAFADKKGYVDLSGTLYDRLQRQTGPTSVAFEISHRRGSV